MNTIPSTSWLQNVSSSNIDVVIDGGGAASIGGQQIITIPDPITGEPVQHLVQTIIDPETGEQTEVITNLTTNTVSGITMSMKCRLHTYFTTCTNMILRAFWGYFVAIAWNLMFHIICPC